MRPATTLHTGRRPNAQSARMKPSDVPGLPVHPLALQAVDRFREAIKDLFCDARMSELDEDAGGAFLEDVEELYAAIQHDLKPDPGALRYVETRLQRELARHAFAPNIAVALHTITRMTVRQESADAALGRVIRKRIDQLKVRAQGADRLVVAQQFIQLQHKVFNSKGATVRQQLLQEIEDALLALSAQFPGEFIEARDSLPLAYSALDISADITRLHADLADRQLLQGADQDIGMRCIDLAMVVEAEATPFQQVLARQLLGVCRALASSHADPAMRTLMRFLMDTEFSQPPPRPDQQADVAIHLSA